MLFRDEDGEEEGGEDEEEGWVKCVNGRMTGGSTKQGGSTKRKRGRLDGVQWGGRVEGVAVVEIETETETREWDGGKKGVQVDGRW